MHNPKDTSCAAVMARKNEILLAASGIDFAKFESGSIAFDYEGMLRSTGYTFDEVRRVQALCGVGNTPLLELRNISALARKLAPVGMGARIFIKDEAANPSGSFKDRRAATAVYHAKRAGFSGVLAATSGNYGAAVASQAARQGLKCIVVQECYDSRRMGQPEILEKARKCEAYGAEVLQCTVGPELFYIALRLLEDTGYFSASLYSPFGVTGVETLGYELVQQCMELAGRMPDAVVCTHAGGGNITGTGRGLLRANCNAQLIGASVNLSGLHMASDGAFNRKSFTTGHTGFGIPFATWPDRSDVPRSGARSLRYMDRYVTVNQGEVFYMTELLASLEGLERGPAGNTSLAAAFHIAQSMPEDAILVVQETEYTGAGKHPLPQLSFARQNGIGLRLGDPAEEVPGESIILPEHPSLVRARDVDIVKMRTSLLRNALQYAKQEPTEVDIAFLAEDTKTSAEWVRETLRALTVERNK
ncbi:MAG: 2-amino-4-oxopentanoate thiolase subunit OrtB [Clostridiales bacterium]|nr:2-amino-4-oxopentanoate thiolase subunit OrtB [Clostridiales bacterium]